MKNGPRIDLIEHRDGPFKVYQRVEKYMEYVIGVDVATGVINGDFQIAQVLRRDTLDQVAVYSNKTDIGIFARDINYLGRYYNDAWVCPERNAVGEAFIFAFVELYLTNRIYHEDWMQKIKKGRQTQVEKFGFYTAGGARSKQLLVMGIQEYQERLRTGESILVDRDTVEQMMEFQIERLERTNLGSGLGYKAARNKHDDRVMALGLALMMDRVLPPFVSRAQEIMSWAKMGKKQDYNQPLSIGWPGQ